MAGNAGMGHPANKIYTRMVESLKNPNKNTSNYVIKLKRVCIYYGFLIILHIF